MSKERLEEIKRTQYQIMELSKSDMQADFNYLLNYIKRRDKRVQELEETNKKNYWIAADFKFENLKLEQQNKRYREALDSMRLHAHHPEIIKQIYDELERESE